MFIALRWMQRPASVMVWLAGNIQACLSDLQTGTSSMAHMRHLASTARGFYCFCLMALTGPVSVQSVQSVVEKKSRGKLFILLLSNSPAETDFPVKPRILDCSSKKNREKFAE